uniref:Reverse transcriptase domain-containing protein n=1 Tax=Nicotiana tabacum TaxID=4097 RepID=A0A1S4B2E4_TOBAC|nr:PREDICTED: uncharacterized protein LOC107803766 [Nicotiana tabacum]
MTELVSSHTASIQKLEMQMRDLSREQNPKQKGTLPSDTIANPKGNGSGTASHCISITTRSGKILQGENEQIVEVEDPEQEVKIQEVNREEVKEKVKETPKVLEPVHIPPPPFPQRLARRVDDSKLEKFYDILKQLSVNIPFVEAFQEMSVFAKYLKDLITKKKTTKNEVVNVPHRVSSIIVITIVQKKEDPGEVPPADFVILDCVVDKEIPIILWILFLDTGRALMDLERNEIKFRVNDEEVTFQASKGMKFPHAYESISVIDIVDEVEDAVELKMEEECLGEALAAILVEHLLDTLREHRHAIKWTIADIGGIPDGICEHKYNWSKRANLAWSIKKKGGMTVIQNAKNELIPTRTVTGWRVCMDYRKLDNATWKDHFLMPFIDQMLDRLAGRSFYYFLHGYSGYNQINIALEDQEKTTFTCLYGAFAFSRMLFGLCNAPATFQRCMMSIFSDMVEDFLEVFMDDFSVVGDSFEHCLDNLR